jgi:ABC-type enterochelin transport system ATPase subunit
MQLIIQNFGPIKQGQIDLSKQFYIFVGYNNSGKTYVSQLLWSIFNEQTLAEFVDNEEVIAELSKSVEIEHFKGEGCVEITEDFITEMLARFSQFLISEVIPRTFNIERGHFTQDKLFLKFEPDFNALQQKPLEARFGDSTRRLVLSKAPNSLTVQFKNEVNNPPYYDNTVSSLLLKTTAPFSNTQLLIKFIGLMLFETVCQTFFLPASRLFYLIFYQYIYRLEKEKNDKITQRARYIESNGSETSRLKSLLSLISSLKNPYTAPMNWLFDKIYRLNENAVAQSYYDNLVAELARIMDGEIVMKKSQGIAPLEFYLNMLKSDRDLEMYLSSSSVHQLSTLYLYFKYWANKDNNYLMIDEPEENLHPKNQMALLNVLLTFANETSNKVLITTHSPFLAEMVNNYLFAAFLKSNGVPISRELVNDPEMNLELDLTVEDIGIYFFDGDNIRAYKMGEYGVLFEDFNYEIRKSHRIRDILTDQIYHFMYNDEE